MLTGRFALVVETAKEKSRLGSIQRSLKLLLTIGRRPDKIESIIQKKILTELPDGEFLMQPSVLAEYYLYLSKVSHFRATEMSRVYKNPILAAIKHGI